MNIFFRVDASIEIGAGHVMRCLTLAEWLRNEETQIFFICRNTKGHLKQVIEQNGYQVLPLEYGPFDIEQDAKFTIAKTVNYEMDVLIIDHYGIDIDWEKKLRPYVKKLVVIDDLANRKHDCDMLLDQNYFINMDMRYKELVPKDCKLLLGPQFLLLRKEFYQAEKRKRHDVKCIFVFFGGSDPTNETEKVLYAINQLELKEVETNVVVGSSNPNRDRIENLCKQLNANFYCQIDNMAEVMARADLALGAGGIAMWERCYVGLPSLVTIVADNQRRTTEDAAQAGAIELLGWHEDVTIATYAAGIKRLLQDTCRRSLIQKNGYALVGAFSNFKVHPVVYRMKELFEV